MILLGLDNAGKTTFLEQVKAIFNPPNPDSSALNAASPLSFSSSRPIIGKTVPTVGQNVSTLPLPDMYLKIWDVGGQLALRKLWQSYYSSCHAIIFIIDSTDIGDGNLDRLSLSFGGASGGSGGGGDGGGAASAADTVGGDTGRLEECRLVLEDVLHHVETEGVPLLILANKQDREDCVEVVRIKEGLVKRVFEGEKSGCVRDSRVLPISALTGTGVSEAVEWVRSRVKWNKESRPPNMR